MMQQVSKKVNPIDTNTLVGLTTDVAIATIKEFEMVPRIRVEDGKSFMGTCDARQDRVNLHITQGKIVKAYIG